MTSFASKPYRGRLAPSPTGYLHLGHARTFATAQRRASERNGSLILRIEDLDRERCNAAFDEAIVEDLRWYGLEWQEGPDAGGPHGPYRQSERRALYLTAWQRLAAAGAIYACECTRRDIQRAAQAPHEEDESREMVYPGTCRPDVARTAAMVAAPPRQPDARNWRFRVLDGETIMFVDGCAGPQFFVAGEDFGDFVIWRKDGTPSYQLAVVVDDAAMAITEVVRGADLLLSTAQQLLLYRALGLVPPAFFHCPLVTDDHGRRLAKRAGAQSLHALREAASTPGHDRIGPRAVPPARQQPS